MQLFQILVKELGDNSHDFFLVPVNATVGSPFYQVAVGRDAFLLQRLEEKIGLARGNDEIFGTVHEEHGRTGFGNIGDGIGCFGCFGIG